MSKPNNSVERGVSPTRRSSSTGKEHRVSPKRGRLDCNSTSASNGTTASVSVADSTAPCTARGTCGTRMMDEERKRYGNRRDMIVRTESKGRLMVKRQLSRLELRDGDLKCVNSVKSKARSDGGASVNRTAPARALERPGRVCRQSVGGQSSPGRGGRVVEIRFAYGCSSSCGDLSSSSVYCWQTTGEDEQSRKVERSGDVMESYGMVSLDGGEGGSEKGSSAGSVWALCRRGDDGQDGDGFVQNTARLCKEHALSLSCGSLRGKRAQEEGSSQISPLHLHEEGRSRTPPGESADTAARRERLREGAHGAAMELQTLLTVLLAMRAALVLRTTAVSGAVSTFLLLPEGPQKGTLIPLTSPSGDLPHIAVSAPDAPSLPTTPRNHDEFTSTSDHPTSPLLSPSSPPLHPTQGATNTEATTTSTAGNTIAPPNTETIKRHAQSPTSGKNSEAVTWQTLLCQYDACLHPPNDKNADVPHTVPSTIVSDLLPRAIQSLPTIPHCHGFVGIVLDHLLAQHGEDAGDQPDQPDQAGRVSADSSAGGGGEPMLLTREELSYRVQNRTRGDPTSTAQPSTQQTQHRGTHAAQDSLSLMRLIQLQVMIRIQLYTMHAHDHDDLNNFRRVYSTMLAQAAAATATSATSAAALNTNKNKSKAGKKKKKRKTTKSNNSGHDILADICSILELIPFLMPSSHTFSKFLTHDIMGPFYSSSAPSKLITEIANYFEVDIPQQSHNQNQRPVNDLNDDPVVEGSISSPTLDKTKASRSDCPKATISQQNSLVTGGDDTLTLKNIPNMNDKKGSSDMKTKTQAPSRWETIAIGDIESNKTPSHRLKPHQANAQTQSDPSPSSSPSPSPSSPQKPHPYPLAKDLPLLRKSIDFKVPTNSRNPLLADGRGRYVGSHFTQKLSNISKMFHQVKMVQSSSPPTSSKTRRKHSRTESSPFNMNQDRIKRHNNPRGTHATTRPLQSRRKVLQSTRCGDTLRQSEPGSIPALRKLSLPTNLLGASSMVRMASKMSRKRKEVDRLDEDCDGDMTFHRRRRHAASLAAEACLAMRKKK